MVIELIYLPVPQDSLRAAWRVLPDEGDETEAGAQAVFGIAGQFLAQDFFLVEQAKT